MTRDKLLQAFPAHRARQALKKEIETHCDLHCREAGVLCCAPKPDRT